MDDIISIIIRLIDTEMLDEVLAVTPTYNVFGTTMYKIREHNVSQDLIISIKHDTQHYKNLLMQNTSTNDSKNKNTLTDQELLVKVGQELDKLIKTGGKSFIMRVPAEPNNDTDLLLYELWRRFKEKIEK